MKKILTTAVCSAALLSAATAHAGGYSDPVIQEPIEIGMEESASSNGNIVPLLLLLLVGAAIVGSSGDSDPETPTDTDGPT